jgi:hypothetical protein
MEKDAKPAEAVENRIRGKFKSGVSGNPKGRTPGTRNRSTMAAFETLRANAGALSQLAIDLAMAGDVSCLKICLDKLLPQCRDAPIEIKLPQIVTVADLPQFTSALLDAVSVGLLQPSEAEKLCKVVQAHKDSILIADFESRIAELEAQAGAKGGRR